MSDIPLRLLISEHKTGADILKTIGAVGVASLIGVGIAADKMAADYQTAMTQLQNTTGSSDAQMQGYKATIRSLSDTTGVAQTDLAKGMYQIVSANFAGADASKILATATRSAIIAGADQTQVTTGLVVSLNAFGLKANQVDKVSNQMFKTLGLGRGQMGDLAGALQTGGALVAHYGVSITDMDATLATLSTGGMKTFGTSMTGLTQLLNVMDGKTDLITKRIHKLGISFDENKFKAMDYEQQIAYLGEAFKGHEKAMVSVLGSKQAATALGILGTQSQLLAQNTQKLSNTQELAKEKTTAWGKVQNDAAFQLQKLETNVQNIGIDLGLQLLPILSKVMDWVTPLVKKFGDWVLTNKDLHKWLSNVTTFIQYTVVPAFQNTWNAVSTLVGWMQKGSGPAQALKDILGGIALVVAGQKIGQMVTDISNLGTKAADFVTGAGKNLIAFFTGDTGLKGAADKAGASVTNIGNDAEANVSKVQGAAASEEEAFATTGDTARTTAGDVGLIGDAAEADVPKVEGAATAMKGALSGVLGMLQGLSLMGVNIGEQSGASGVQSQLQKTQGQNMPWLQYEWERVHGFQNFGKMPSYSSMTGAQQSVIVADWYKSHPGQAFPWSTVVGFASGGPVTQDGLIYAHKGEHVLSADQVRAGSGGGITNNYYITVNNPMRTRQDTARLVDEIEQEQALRFRMQTPNYGSGRAF